MKIEELRYGNHVFDQYTDGTKYLTTVGIQQLEYPHNCEPIPLTGEILVNNCGFTKYKSNNKDNRFIHEESGFELEQQGNKFALVIWSEHTPCTTHFIGHHEFLHELQNLFKIIENEELTLKL